ncbi:small ribosomal subunit Rsm22 family protein [Arvimicrobium flavum]|uniref:small ribosomal subunit Rsm22 family protein n=1 Tax=Arvimicrobium flavum TaxID=3393320 RepID=UPI00237BF1AD|nr:small ribosomal subunit Rsm22 family protein [Mesorhizobium shangrilense]
MELPAPLRAAIDAVLDGISLSDLQRAATRLSTRYRAETQDGTMHLDEELAVKAYLATRMPATYAAVRSSFDAAREVLPDFEPKTFLDVGAGPGTALWAAGACWPTIASATLVEGSAPALATGARLATAHPVAAQWLAGDVSSGLRDLAPADLVSIAYVLDELPSRAIAPLIERLWSLTAGVLMVVEPGTPAGWKRILAVREQLIAGGAHIVAPCPHMASCPITEPDWCHFSRKVARSRVHRLAKGAEAPWEEEKFVYLAASRAPQPSLPRARVIAPPRTASGRVRLKLCSLDGSACERLLTKRDGQAYRDARRADWGDAL